MRGTRNRGSSLLTLLIPAGREGTCVYVCTHVCSRTRMCDQARWNIGRMLFVRTKPVLAFVVFLSFTGRPFGGRLVEVAVERTNRTRTRTRKRSIKDRARERRIHDTWEPSINSTHPCYFKQRHEAMLAFATRTHHTLLENVQILFLTPPLSCSFSLFFVFFFLLPRFPFSLPHHLQMNGINEEEFTNKKHVYVNFYVKIYYFRNSNDARV